MKNKIIFLLLLALMLTLFTCACANTSSTQSDSNKNLINTRTIIDAAGREVQIPQQVTTVVPLANALRMMCYADAIDLVAGVELGESEQTLIKAYNWVNFDSIKDLPIVGNGGSGGYAAYEEELIQLNPDVIICAYTPTDAQKLQEKTGIPVIVIHAGTLFGEDYNESLRIIGKVCKKEARCEEVITYINNAKKDLENRTKSIPNENKPKVYTGAVSYKGRHGIEGTYSNFPPFTVLHAIDILNDINTSSKGIVIDKEKILIENPDYIFLDPYNVPLVNADYAINQEYYLALSAISNNHVYTMLGYNYYYTNVEIALADCYYVGTILYPKQFSDIDAEEQAKEIFNFFLASDTYYQDLKDAGLGFGEITLEEIND